MAKPRIFISSTYYDLKHVRSSLDHFIESLGFESVLSEKGDVVYSPDVALDESCYREAASADIFVLLIGGRYGSAASGEGKRESRGFFERYESITKKEYDSAWSRDIPVYILIEQNVYSEYQTYLRNKDDEKIRYAHVDSINIFRFIEDILSKPHNNPVHTFERFSDMEGWLREQWAGLFRELLVRVSSQKQISTLSGQVETMAAINATLKTYLETIMSKVAPENAKELIKSEEKRLEEVKQIESLKANRFYLGALKRHGVTAEQFREALVAADNFVDFAKRLEKTVGDAELGAYVLGYKDKMNPIVDINEGRVLLGKSGFEVPGEDSEVAKVVMKRRTVSDKG